MTDSKEIPYEEILEHLNEVNGCRYSHKTKKTRTLIKARWEDGYRLNDFKYVHAVKMEEWIRSEYVKYVRPSTLYTETNFENYLNQKPKSNFDKLPDKAKANALLCYEKMKDFANER